MANTAPITLQALFRYYKGLPHQAAAISLLEQDLAANGYQQAMRRDRPWFEAWSQDGKQVDLSVGINLIKQFEGVHLSAYPDPLSGGDPWTIGYGTTRYSGGVPVKRGDKITMIEADMMLRLEVDRIAGFYGTPGFETISKVLREQAWDKAPAAMELYRNPGTNVEAGLLRRRKAEGELWGDHRPKVQQEPARLTPDSSFSARITPHIRLGEFALDQEARRFRHQYQVNTAAELAAFLERVRQRFGGKSIILTSGYRPAAINASVGGATNSEHLYSAPGVGAVDFVIDGADMKAVEKWCDENWPYSLGYAAPAFIHLGRRADGKRRRWDYA